MSVSEKKQKAKSKGFAELGVPVGAVITFRRDATITATVVDEKNKVEYQGKVYPISGLAKELMKTAISGYNAFKYNGVLLSKLCEGSTKTTTTPVSASMEKPVVEAFVTPTNSTAPVSQTIPLPSPHNAPVAVPKANSEVVSEVVFDEDPLMAGDLLEAK